MRKFTVTVNGQDYDVVVKDGGAAAAVSYTHLVEACKIGPNGEIYPTTAIGNSPVYVDTAKKVIVEVNTCLLYTSPSSRPSSCGWSTGEHQRKCPSASLHTGEQEPSF